MACVAPTRPPRQERAENRSRSYARGSRRRGRSCGRDPKGGGVPPTRCVKLLARCLGIARRGFPAVSAGRRRAGHGGGEISGLGPSARRMNCKTRMTDQRTAVTWACRMISDLTRSTPATRFATEYNRSMRIESCGIRGFAVRWLTSRNRTSYIWLRIFAIIHRIPCRDRPRRPVPEAMTRLANSSLRWPTRDPRLDSPFAPVGETAHPNDQRLHRHPLVRTRPQPWPTGSCRHRGSDISRHWSHSRQRCTRSTPATRFATEYNRYENRIVRPRLRRSVAHQPEQNIVPAMDTAIALVDQFQGDDQAELVAVLAIFDHRNDQRLHRHPLVGRQDRAVIEVLIFLDTGRIRASGAHRRQG